MNATAVPSVFQPFPGLTRRLAMAMALAAWVVPPSQAGSLQPEELQILGKALNFMEPALNGPVSVAVVYRDGNDASRRDAESLAAQIDVIDLGGQHATAAVVSSLSLADARFQLIVTAAGVDSEPVIEAAQAHRALCVTADVDAVRAGHCTMAIRAARKVEIFVNRGAAIQTGIGFATAFRMMVHEQ